MKAKICKQSARANVIHRLIISLLVLVAFTLQQVVLAQPDTTTKQQKYLLARMDGVTAPSGSSAIDAVRPYDNRTVLWWRLLEEQFVRSVDSPIEKIREGTLQNVIFFAHVYGDRVQLNRVVPALLDIYMFEENEAHRLMALAALHTIGNEYAMQVLAEHLRLERPGRVRGSTLTALADYYQIQTN